MAAIRCFGDGFRVTAGGNSRRRCRVTIEFRCGTCQKLLRTTDDKAGATAKCPQCASPVLVPAAPAKKPAEEEWSDEPASEEEEWAPPPGAKKSSSGPKQPCPMCGEQIPVAAARCRFCGEQLSRGAAAAATRRGPGHVDAGEVISASWRIFQSQMGICIGLVILGVVINGGITFGAQRIAEVVQLELMRGNPGNFGLAIAVGLVIGQIPPLLVGSFLNAGMQRGLLKVARGENAEIGDLFTGGPYYLRMLGNSILFQIIISVGIVLCIVPGILLALMFWPFGYVLVDRDSPGMECLSEAKEITQNTWLQVFVLWLAVFGITLLGMVPLCVGLIFTIPLTSLMFAVAYCHMTGQPTADESLPG
jgi:hypothetical protein